MTAKAMRPLQHLVAVAILVLAGVSGAAQGAKKTADTLLQSGFAAGQKGEALEAVALLLKAKAIYRQQGDRREEAVTLRYLGSAYADQGKKTDAVNCFEQALALLRGLGDKVREASMLNTLAKAYLGLGESAKALACYQQDLTIQLALKNQEAAAAVLNNLGGLYRDLGEPAKARNAFELALQQEWGKPSVPLWVDKANLSFVAMGGNASSQTMGFANEFTYNWSAASALAINAAAVRVASRVASTSATGSSPSNFELSNTETDQVTAADYTANARFAQDLTEKYLWFAGGGWERNIPAGIDNRAVGSVGAGVWWTRSDRRSVQTDLGLGYTKAVPVVQSPGFPVSYATVTAVVAYYQKIGAAAAFTSNLSWANALRESGNFLAVWHNDLETTISRRLALKVGYTVTYNNRPAFQAVPIVLAGSVPPVVVGQTFVELKKLDTLFNLGLVVSF
jgi:tetratricopeptide (TPR) repeat protein